MEAVQQNAPDRPRRIGAEISKSIDRKLSDGFVARYLSGDAILDIGYRGYNQDIEPVLPQAVGVELDYPGYDGQKLPFADCSQDAVFTSHCLEHITDYQNAFREWHRVLKIGGFMVVMVPHQFLYEKKTSLPSRWNPDHKRFYTPASLMAEVEQSLTPNTYRLRHLIDHDYGFDYRFDPTMHSGGCYEIEMVLERIAPPAWELEEPLPKPEPEPDLSTAQPMTDKATFVQRLVVGGWQAVRPVVKPFVSRSLRSRLGKILWK